ncbi:MAG: hypothetical protein IPJ01_12200 [Micavibrio sp.]|nr:hypothetical protein [Micavibrio sp.]
MTKIEHKKLTAFFKSIFEPGDAVALSLLPVKGAPAGAKPAEKVLPLATFTAQATPEFFERTKKENRFACFTPNPQTLNRARSEANTKTLNAVFIDIDGAALPAFAEFAHYVLRRDDSHFHLYFLIERIDADAFSRTRVRAITKQIIAATGADRAVHDPARVLRIPYAPHVKNGVEGPGYTIDTARDLPRYTLDELERIATDNGPAVGDASGNREKYVAETFTRRGAVYAGDGRSRTLFFIGLDCHGWGIPETNALALAAELNEKICQPPETAATVAHQIKSAYKYRKAPFGDFLTAADEKERKRRLETFEETQRVRDILTNHVYVVGADILINRDTREQYTTERQQNLYIAHACATRLNLAALVREHAVNVVDRLDFRPDVETDLYEKNGVEFYNRYRPHVMPDATGGKKPGKLFAEHLKFLTASHDEYEILLSFFAYVCQYPGRKISWAPLIVSQNHGVGKSILELLFRNIFGREYVTAVEGFELSQPQTDFLTDKLLVIGEEIELGEKNAMPRLRSLITRDSYRNIAKYQRTYDSSNVANFLFFSNRIDALRVDKFDRRLFVVFNRKTPQPAAYYKALADAFTNNAADIRAFLLAVDLSAFDPNDRPAVTEGKTLLIEQSKSEVEIYLYDEMRNGSGEFAYPVVSVQKILSHIAVCAPDSVKRFCGQKSIQYFLIQNGYRSERHRVTEEGESVQRRVWFQHDEKAPAVDVKKLIANRARMEFENDSTDNKNKKTEVKK